MDSRYYNILGVSRDATDSQIKDAYRKLALKYHPDRNRAAGAEDKFKLLNEAYAYLSDKKNRKQDSGSKQYQAASRPSARPGIKYTNVSYSDGHIRYTYDVLRRQRDPEFRPFADHNFRDSDYNRYRYDRNWDPYRRRWVYTNSPNASIYEEWLKKKHNILGICVSLLTLGFMSFSILKSLVTETHSSRSKRLDNLRKNRVESAAK